MNPNGATERFKKKEEEKNEQTNNDMSSHPPLPHFNTRNKTMNKLNMYKFANRTAPSTVSVSCSFKSATNRKKNVLFHDDDSKRERNETKMSR